MLRIRRKNWSIGFSNRTWRCRTRHKTKSLPGMVRRPSINTRISEPSFFTRSRTRKVFLEPGISPQRNFIPKRIVADALLTTPRRTQALQIQNLLMRIRPRAAWVTHLSLEKRPLLVPMRITGRFWARAQIRRHLTRRTSRSPSSRYGSC